jgi:hypothetical protein
MAGPGKCLGAGEGANPHDNSGEIPKRAPLAPRAVKRDLCLTRRGRAISFEWTRSPKRKFPVYSTLPARIRETVYVVGAGFSAGLGYPLTKSLLVEAWDRLEEGPRTQLGKIIEFHHPAFIPERKTTFPGIEELLAAIAVNLELFDASRPAEGGFTKRQLEESREELLSTIARWFHELYEGASVTPWLSQVIKRLRRENAAIISFNWDLLLDQLLFDKGLGSDSYGLSKTLSRGPMLLKPHGSLNWYDATRIQKVPDEKRIEIFRDSENNERIEAFLPPREIRSKSGRRYTPLIIPPTYLKSFNRPVFQRLWNRCTGVLSTARRLVFLGYSMPAADLHAQFIFRCGFHNQIEGRLREDGSRYSATGPAEVIIVNPEQEAARRIEAVAGPKIKCEWVSKRVQEWFCHGG